MRFSAVVFVLALTLRAGAEPPDEARRAEARAHFEKGAQAYERGRYKLAIDEFLLANGVLPSPALSFNIARAYEKLGDDSGALAFYRDYLRRAQDPPDRQQIESRVHQLELVLRSRGIQQVTVSSTPARATVVIDGVPVGVTPWTGDIAPGPHRVELRLTRHREAGSTFTLASHRALDVHLTLEPEAATVPAGPPAAAASPAPVVREPRIEQEPSRRPETRGVSTVTWITLGAGVAFLGGALASELRRASLEEGAHDASTQRRALDRYDEMESWQTTARVLAGAGIIVTVVGGSLLYFDLSSSSRERVGLSVSGSF